MSKSNNLLHIVDYKTDQIIGVIQEKNYWNDIRQWEIKNNIDQLEFNTMDGTKESAKLMQQNLIVKQTRDGTFVSYVITESEQDSVDRSKKIHALGEHTKLKKAAVFKPQTLQATTVNESTDFALQGTEWKRGITEYSGVRTIHIKDFTNPLDFLKQIASTFGLEIRFRTEILGSFIVGRYVDLVKKVGRDNGKEFVLGKDVQGIRRIENSQDVVTALVGVGPSKENPDTGKEEFLTFEDINDGKLYVSNNDALQRWSKDGKHLFDIYSPQTENQDMTKQRLKQLTEAELAKRINSSTLYEVDAVALEKVFGLSHEAVRKGDTVRIKDTGFSPPLFLEARLIAADEYDTDPSKDKYIFGDYREIADTRSLIDRLYAQIMGSLSNKASKELLDMLDKKLQENIKETEVIRKESEAAKKIAEQVAENLKNNTVDIIEGVNPPTANLKDRKTLWQDISKGKPGILKLWKDGKWDPVIPDVESVKKETLAQVSKDIEATKSELNEKVQSVEGKAQEIAGQISDVKKEVQGKVDSNFVKEQIKDKADKSGVFTKDEINNGFIGKQIYETDKQGNVKKFQEISTSFEQTNEVIKSKAEKQSVTDLGNNLTQVSKTANEAKQTAEGSKQTISDLKATVENTEIGVRNLLLETADKSHAVKTGENKSHTYFDVAKDAATLMQGKNLAMSFLFTGTVTVWGTTNKWVGFEVKITFTDNTFQYRSCRVENRLTLGKQYNQERFTASAVVMDKPIKEISVYALARDFTGDTLIEKPKLEIGTVPTAWTPAPEDQVTTTDFTKKTVDIESTIKGINSSVSDIQNAQGKLTERVTKSEQTADGFKQSIESLTKKDNDFSNKLNTVEQTVDGTKKTITDVQQTTNSLSKTTTEIKEQAGKISTKLESIEGSFGGRNIIKNTIEETTTFELKPKNNGDAADNYNYARFYADMELNETYTFSAKVRFTKGTSNEITIYPYPDGATIKVPLVNGKVKCTFKHTKETTNSVIVYAGIAGETRDKGIIIEESQLEKGIIATDYNPNPSKLVSGTEFTKKNTEIEKSVNGIKETVTKVDNNQSGFDKRVTAVEKTADGISQNVTKMYETQTAQGKQITDAQSTIKQHSDALDLTVKMKDLADTYI
ncbi:phage tail spike protein [Bacillus toyonensis]